MKLANRPEQTTGINRNRSGTGLARLPHLHPLGTFLPLLPVRGGGVEPLVDNAHFGQRSQ